MGTDYSPLYEAAGKSWNVDPALLQSVAQVESGENPAAVSPAGARGLMQLMPQTSGGLGVTDPHDPTQAVFGAAKMLSGLLDKYQRPDLALAAYNAGPGAVDAHLAGQSFLPAETVSYVPKVMTGYQSLSRSRTMAPIPDATVSARGTAGPAASDLDAAIGLGGPAAAPAPASPTGSDLNTALGVAPAAAAVPLPSGPLGTTAHTIGAGVTQGATDLTLALNKGAAAMDAAHPWLATLDRAFGQNPAAAAATQQAQADQYAKTYKGNNVAGVARVLGNAAPTMLLTGGLLGGASAALGASGNALADAAPIAGRIVQGAGNLLSGEVGTGVVGKAVGLATQGGAGGAAAAAMNGGNPLRGAIEGAVMTPIGAGAVKAATTVLPKVGNALLDFIAPATTKASTNALADAVATPAADAAAPAAGAPGTPDETSPEDLHTIKTVVVGPDGTAQMTAAPAASATPQPAASIPAAPPLGIHTQAAADARADQIITALAKGGPTDIPMAAIPGAKVTLGTIGNANLAGLHRTLASLPEAANQFAAVDAANQTARQAALANLIGAPQQVEAMEAAREAATSASRTAAFAKSEAVDAQPVVDHLNDLISSNTMRPTVQAPLQQLRDVITNNATRVGADGPLLADPADLYNARKYLSDIVSPKAAGTANDGRAAAQQLLDVKPTLDDVIEKGAPGFKDYIQQYDQMSRPIDGLRYLQGLNLTDANGNTTLVKLDSALKGLTRAQGKNGYQMADSVTPDQATALAALRENLRQNGSLALGKALGSNTAQNLASGSMLKGVTSTSPMTLPEVAGHVGLLATNPLAGVASIGVQGVRRLLGAQSAKGEAMVQQALIDRFTNPQLAAAALKAAAGP